MTEQFHLSRLQVINWGVFDGYHSIPFSEGGALIAGASGSGKSSLLDAISLGFLPFNRRNFNASGDNTAAGSSAGRRTVDKTEDRHQDIKLPDERNGLLYVFRPFERASYALVIEIRDPVKIGDRAENPLAPAEEPATDSPEPRS